LNSDKIISKKSKEIVIKWKWNDDAVAVAVADVESFGGLGRLIIG